VQTYSSTRSLRSTERSNTPTQPDVFREVLREAITQRLQRAQEINNAILGREIQEGLKVLLTPPPRVRRSTMASTTASRGKQGAVVKGHSRGREGGRRSGPRRKQQVPVRRKQNGLLGVQGGRCQGMLGKWRKKQRCGRCHSSRACPPPLHLHCCSLALHLLVGSRALTLELATPCCYCFRCCALAFGCACPVISRC
jgi:hypothetical protein